MPWRAATSACPLQPDPDCSRVADHPASSPEMWPALHLHLPPRCGLPARDAPIQRVDASISSSLAIGIDFHFITFHRSAPSHLPLPFEKVHHDIATQSSPSQAVTTQATWRRCQHSDATPPALKQCGKPAGDLSLQAHLASLGMHTAEVVGTCMSGLAHGAIFRALFAATVADARSLL